MHGERMKIERGGGKGTKYGCQKEKRVSKIALDVNIIIRSVFYMAYEKFIY